MENPNKVKKKKIKKNLLMARQQAQYLTLVDPLKSTVFMDLHKTAAS